jgi:membrane fusion protein (multidrug efflux system)
MSTRDWLSRFLGLAIVTSFGLAVMVASATKWLSWGGAKQGGQSTVQRPVAELPPSPVLVVPVRRENIEITDRYSGLLEPLERYRLSFEISGRIEKLGVNADGQPLDDGDRIRQGQALAVLDQRGLLARLEEVQALAAQAKKEFDRAERLRRENERSITEAEYIQRETELKVTQAKLKLALKAVDDATLTSKVDGVISRRMANIGESVGPQQLVFEVVQTDFVLLVVGVPESRITAVVDRLSEANRQRLRPDSDQLPLDERTFIARVTLAGKDPLGVPRKPMIGAVRRVAQTADQTSGLFSVEILLQNADQRLRPGQIAIADLIVGQIDAYRIPITSAQFTDNRAFVFFVDGGNTPVLPPQEGASYLAVRHELVPGNYFEQGTSLIVIDFPADNIVLRGQHRLVSDRPVKVLTAAESDVLGNGMLIPVVRMSESGAP